MLILLCGLPGTGKSTLAKRITRRYSATILQTDEVRKEIIKKPTYSQEEKRLVYKVVFLITKYLLKSKRNVILDGTFYKRKLRNEAYKIADECKNRFIIIECTAPEEVIKKRMKRRISKGRGLSDADYDVYLKIKKQFEPIRREHLTVDTTKPFNTCVDEILEYLKKIRSKPWRI
jgi:hypothetical protein